MKTADRKASYYKWIMLLTLFFASSVALPVRAQTMPETRPFYLGFSPFPYDISTDAVNFSYKAIAEHADIVMHHFDDGVPWSESLSGAAYHQALQDDWNWRKSHTPKDHEILASIAPYNFMRDGLANYHGERGDMPRSAPWGTATFNDPDVKTAYLNYCRRVIDFFDPAFINIGIEANLIMEKAPQLWDAYMDLHRYVYTELKKRYPDLPVFVSFQLQSLLKGHRPEVNHDDQMRAFRDLIDYTDIFAFSSYPYASAYMTQKLPEDMFDELAKMSSKPMAISETGYIAQDLTIKALKLTMPSNEDKQAAWIDLVLRKAQQYKFTFVINFVIRDYDPLYEKIGGGDLAAVWRDTGLFDENGKPRKALTLWDKWLKVPYRR